MINDDQNNLVQAKPKLNIEQNSKISKLNQEQSNIHVGRSSSLVRTLALRAKGRRFKSGSAHHLKAFLVFGGMTLIGATILFLLVKDNAKKQENSEKFKNSKR